VALAAPLSRFYTVEDASARHPRVAIGNAWSRRLFDGHFYRAQEPGSDRPLVSRVFVQSRDGNTVADNPATLGGGETDTHLIYEGLSRVDADAVLSGATTARGERIVFSVWPQKTRRSQGRFSHEAHKDHYVTSTTQHEASLSHEQHSELRDLCGYRRLRVLRGVTRPVPLRLEIRAAGARPSRRAWLLSCTTRTVRLPPLPERACAAHPSGVPTWA